MGSSRLVGHWARLPKFGPPPRFSGRCAVGGRPLCSVGGLQAREGKKFKLKHPFSFFPAACLGGRRKMNNVVQNDTVLLSFFFSFFFVYMKRRRFGENAPFHLNMAPERAKFQISPLIIFFSFNCIPANFGLRPSCWPRFSL
jgi:hypothetical protein